MKPYNVIYADPPWKYALNGSMKNKRSAGELHYSTLSYGELVKLAPPTDENCALFLWATFPEMQQALNLIKAWGFSYKTVAFTWIKTNKKYPTPFFGMGYYTRANAEVCLLGIKGKMKPVKNNIHSVIHSPIERHSKKPDEARKRIEELFGDVPRLEMFAREKAAGWDSWGNEIQSDIKITIQP